jgi:DNA repair ATPase RecN
MEARVVEKEAELLQLHERIAEELHGAGKEKGSSKMQAEAEAVEREIEELARELERLRTEADEEFARELAEEEERRVRG